MKKLNKENFVLARIVDEKFYEDNTGHVLGMEYVIRISAEEFWRNGSVATFNDKELPPDFKSRKHIRSTYKKVKSEFCLATPQILKERCRKVIFR